MYSKVIKNGTIIDGTGSKPYVADIAIEKDLIVRIGKLDDAKAREIIDANGKYVAPGFIDVQNHSDVYWTIFDNPSLDSLVAQGITSALIGNCGASLAPLLSPDALLSVQKWHTLDRKNINWRDFKEYMQELQTRKFGVNLASLVGYSTLRRGLIKNEIRELSAAEAKTIIAELEKCMEAGCFGLSSGLSYTHEANVQIPELLAAARAVKEYDGLFSVHLRSEGAELTESIAEILELVNKVNVNLKISHLKVRNKENWHLLPHALSLIEENYQKKGRTHFDVYPYNYTWQVLYTYLPQWATNAGREAMLANLRDPHQRSKILAYITTKEVDYSQIYIASTSMSLNVTGKSIGEIAARQGMSSEETLLNILEHGGSEVLVFDENLNMPEVELLLAHPLGMIGTDGAGFSINTRDSLVHSRCFGTMPKFLELVLQKKFITLEAAVQKITDTPARKIGLKNRGKIAVDYHADLVVFSEDIRSNANKVNPYQYPQGIEHVFINGNFAVREGQLQKEKNGIMLVRK